MNTISNGELSDPLCDSVNRGLTLVRLVIKLNVKYHEACKSASCKKREPNSDLVISKSLYNMLVPIRTSTFLL